MRRSGRPFARSRTTLSRNRVPGYHAGAPGFCAIPAGNPALSSRFEVTVITHILGIEARGFILGAPNRCGIGEAGFIPARKPGKLPWKTRRHDYALDTAPIRLRHTRTPSPTGPSPGGR
jgi:hypothetical protein